MKKQKHPVYRWVMGGLILLLALGIVLLVLGLALGQDRLYLPRDITI